MSLRRLGKGGRDRVKQGLGAMGLCLAVSLLATGCLSSAGEDTLSRELLATKVAQLEDRIVELERAADDQEVTPDPGRPTPSPAPTIPPTETSVSTSTPIPLATLAAKATAGEVTLIKEWQGAAPTRLDAFSVEAPWVIFWTVRWSDSNQPLRVDVFKLGEEDPFQQAVNAQADGQGQSFVFQSGGFQLQFSGIGTARS